MAPPNIECIGRFVLVTADLDAAVETFEALDFEPLLRRRLPRPYGELLGVPESRIDEAMLRLGDQHLSILSFDPPGRPYPKESTSTDLWFQHFAIVVSDMDAAYARLQGFGRFQAISTAGPETLPPSTGSVMAYKFRDAEGHPLELLAFPAGSGPAHWESKRDGGALFLGLDHSAVAVGDSATSVAFFENAFGFKRGARTENAGPEQSGLDGVIDAHVTVSALMAGRAPPHLELLAYHVGSRRPIDGATAAHDVAATTIVLETADLESVVEALTAAQAHFVSPGMVGLDEGASAVLVLDPDGHRFCVVQSDA